MDILCPPFQKAIHSACSRMCELTKCNIFYGGDKSQMRSMQSLLSALGPPVAASIRLLFYNRKETVFPGGSETVPLGAYGSDVHRTIPSTGASESLPVYSYHAHRQQKKRYTDREVKSSLELRTRQEI